jgi:hypothetical protein
MMASVKTILLIVAAAAGLLLAASGIMDRGLAHLGLGDLNQANQRYLDESYDHALDGFLVLSAVKSGLAVIEGSQVGIGFSLQVGDLVQSVYDYVNIAWKTVLAGGTILLMTRLALEGVGLVGHLVMSLTFFSLLMLVAVRGFMPTREGFGRLLRSITATLAFAVVLLYVILPLAVFAASQLSQRLTRPLIQESYDTFSEVSQTFTREAITSGIQPAEDESSAVQRAMGLGERYEHLKTKLRELEGYLRHQAKTLAGTTFQLIAGYLFDCVIFPLAFLAVLILFVRGVPAYLLQAGRERRLARTIGGVVESGRLHSGR